MGNKKLIVFDMDGVIINVSRSYRDTVRQTARLFFDPAQGSEKLPNPFFCLSDLAAVKQSGGLNNDWDLTFVIINLLFSLVKKPEIIKSANPWTRYRKTLNRCNVSALAEFLNSADHPLATLLKQKGKPRDPFIAGVYTGDVGSGNIIKQIFQEIYLGEQRFRETYRLSPEVYHDDGYILREKVLIRSSILEELAKENILAIATGRPRAEAQYPLDHFKLNQYFSIIYTLDDCIAEEKKIFAETGETVSLSKPNPYMLDAIADELKEDISECYYIGDMPDDMLAASRSRAGFKSIGVILSAADKTSLKKNLSQAGADFIIEDFTALKETI